MAYADNSFYCVQILMTSNLVSAEHAFDKIKRYENARIEKINDAFVVRIGTYRSRVKAVSVLKQFKKTYPDAFIKSCVGNSRSIARGKTPAGQKKVTVAQPPPSRHHIIKEEKSLSQSLPAPPVLAVADKPAAAEIPASSIEDHFKIGVKHYNDRNYKSAISSLSQYVSLAPNNNQHASALLVIGKSFAEMDRTPAALRIFSRVMEQYPDRPEATLCIIAVADIGVANPAFRYPTGMKGAEYLKDPVLAYETVSAKNVPESMMEHIQYQKGLFLWKTGRYKESCDVHTAFLKTFPKTVHRKEVVGMLKSGIVTLINQYHGSGDHISAANLFFQAREKWIIGPDDNDTFLKSALSFAHLGLFTVSSNILKTIRIHEKNETSADIEKAAAEIQAIKISAAPSQLPADSKWNLFQSGREYLRASNLPLAEQTLAQLKNTGGDVFWTKLTEYALEDNAWTQKYRGHTGN